MKITILTLLKGFELWLRDRKNKWKKQHQRKCDPNKTCSDVTNNLAEGSPHPAVGVSDGADVHDNLGKVQWEYAVYAEGASKFETLWKQRSNNDGQRQCHFFYGGTIVRHSGQNCHRGGRNGGAVSLCNIRPSLKAPSVQYCHQESLPNEPEYLPPGVGKINNLTLNKPPPQPTADETEKHTGLGRIAQARAAVGCSSPTEGGNKPPQMVALGMPPKNEVTKSADAPLHAASGLIDSTRTETSEPESGKDYTQEEDLTAEAGGGVRKNETLTLTPSAKLQSTQSKPTAKVIEYDASHKAAARASPSMEEMMLAAKNNTLPSHHRFLPLTNVAPGRERFDDHHLTQPFGHIIVLEAQVCAHQATDSLHVPRRFQKVQGCRIPQV